MSIPQCIKRSHFFTSVRGQDHHTSRESQQGCLMHPLSVQLSLCHHCEWFWFTVLWLLRWCASEGPIEDVFPDLGCHRGCCGIGNWSGTTHRDLAQGSIITALPGAVVIDLEAALESAQDQLTSAARIGIKCSSLTCWKPIVFPLSDS